MTTSNYITFILLGVIGLVFLIDFILNSRKKPLEKSVEKFVEKEKSEGKSNFKWLNWILDRKKNITLSLILIPILKVLTHYFFYTETYTIKTFSEDKRGAAKSFGFHLDQVFADIDEIKLFIPVTIVFLVVVWFFNDKIKAR